MTDAVLGEAGLPALYNLTRTTAALGDNYRVNMDMALPNPHGHHCMELRPLWLLPLIIVFKAFD